jgi:thymidine kinase
MAQFYFYYSAMNAGKSTLLLQSSYNYKERGMNTLVLKPAMDNREKIGRVSSRIGLEADAVIFEPDDDLFEKAKSILENYEIACVLVDEAQFLSKEQVRQLTDVCDKLNIPVLAYGLRTDFQGELFPGSAAMFAYAENFVEIKTICHCGRKATMVLRLSADGAAVHEGAQIEIGGNERYMSVCRQHFKDGKAYAG